MHLHPATLFLGAALGIPAASAVSATTNAHDTCEELSRIPMIYRRASFSQLEPETQSQVWQEHIRRYRNEHRDIFSWRQGGLLKEVEERVEKDFGLRDHGDDVDSTETQDELVAEFGAEQAALLFATLGPPDDDDDPDDPSSSPLGGFTQRDGAARRPREPECDCRVGLGRCVSSEDGALCDASSSGCGVWWKEPCDGRRRA